MPLEAAEAEGSHWLMWGVRGSAVMLKGPTSCGGFQRVRVDGGYAESPGRSWGWGRGGQRWCMGGHLEQTLPLEAASGELTLAAP